VDTLNQSLLHLLSQKLFEEPDDITAVAVSTPTIESMSKDKTQNPSTDLSVLGLYYFWSRVFRDYL